MGVIMSSGTATIDHDKLFIGGEWVAPSSDAKIEVISSSTEERIGSVPEAAEADVDAAVDAARRAFDDPSGWAHWEPAARADALEKLADLLEARGEEVAQAVSAQNGMPISLSRMVEATFPPMLLRYYAGLVRATPTTELRDGLLGGTISVEKSPIGVVGAIVPWNYPETLLAFKLAPGLAAGCCFVIKPSPETVLGSFILSECATEAGIPAGVINFVPAGREIGAYLVAHPRIDKVAFTGSTGAGRAIAEVCGRLLRPVTLELGGKSAAIVLDDAELATAAEALVMATLLNNGQTCVLSTRILAPRSRYDEVVGTFGAIAGALKVGPALEETTQIGPMASKTHRERVLGYIEKGKADGGRVVAGGGAPSDLEKGWFVSPTIFADVEPSHTIAREEIFGPVLAVMPYDSLDEAIGIANSLPYGLAGTVWGADPDQALAVARRVQTGAIGINHFMLDPAGPFGGIKDSGLGKELGPEGLAAYQRVQTVYVTPPTLI
jgi:acyl-CoA reductase-like NAD-dependent aldehyde dehydrogenase